MVTFLRKVKTASGATAVQIVEKHRGVRRIVEHLGSAHTEAELEALLRVGQEKLHPTQATLDLGNDHSPDPASAVVRAQRSQLLIDVIHTAYERLGFDVINDEAFFQLVLARLIEPTSKTDSVRVLEELGIAAMHRNSFTNALRRSGRDDYRSLVAEACFTHSVNTSGISLLLYDVTTLYFEAEKEDDYRKVGYSKERRVDPQIVVGLLVDRTGFPLEVHSFEGNKAETHTILPVIKAFQDRHQVADMVVVADAGMLSNMNLESLAKAGLRFIVGSKMTKAPKDLAKHFHWHGTHHEDGRLVDTVTLRTTSPDPERTKTKKEPVWDPEEHPTAWRAVWQYRRKRAVRDQETLNQQRNRAIAVIEGETRPKGARFVKTSGGRKVFDEAGFDRALGLVGWKGYVTNLPASLMPAGQIVGSYHSLWTVEESFRMSKSDLQARPIFHRKRDSIEAHLTVVFTALAVARYLQNASGQSLKRVVTMLRPLREVSVRVGSQELTAQPQIPAEAAAVLKALGH